MAPRITLTPLGLAYYDNTLTFDEVITLQALRYQYPNGHRMVIDGTLKATLRQTPFESAHTLGELLQATGVDIRPGVLCWEILRQLQNRGEDVRLTTDEIQTHLMRCSSNRDAAACTEGIIVSRVSGIGPAPMERGRRNAQDWIKFLLLTPLFTGRPGRGACLELSAYGAEHGAEIDEICTYLAEPANFWKPRDLDRDDRVDWYQRFGTVDLGVALIPEQAEEAGGAVDHTVDLHDQQTDYGSGRGDIRLRDFDPSSYEGTAEARTGQATI